MLNHQNEDSQDTGTTGCCSKENFVDVVLIIADFYCIASRTDPTGYASACNMLAIHISEILQVPLHPYRDFEHFREAYQNPHSDLPRRFSEKLQAVEMDTSALSMQALEGYLKFDELCEEIENRHIAGQLAAAVLPLITRK